MKKTAPLRTPTTQEILATVVLGDLRPELGHPLRECLLVDEHLLDRALEHTLLHHPPLLVATTASS